MKHTNSFRWSCYIFFTSAVAVSYVLKKMRNHIFPVINTVCVLYVLKSEKNRRCDKNIRHERNEVRHRRIYQFIIPTLSLSLEKSVYRLNTTQLSSGLLFTSILYTCGERQKYKKNVHNFTLHCLEGWNYPLFLNETKPVDKKILIRVKEI